MHRIDHKLLARDAFREAVFARDKYTCVFCNSSAVDAHHIMERRLFSADHEKGGYFINNGASVCTKHHLECEMTTISVEDVRKACGITKVIIPDHLYSDQIYDKWANIILPNGTRLRGELFYDESVQKILSQGNVLHLFTNRVKYNRTYHVPWSEGMNDDDRMHRSMDGFVGKRVIVSVKMDGENCSMYSDYIHARSIDSRHHVSRDWVKNFWSRIAADIPRDYRICGENLFAKHSIGYDDLPSYFLGFSIWNEKNICLSWDETIDWFNLLDIIPVSVLYDGIYDEKKIKSLYSNRDRETMEGYVIRLANGFSYGDFRTSVGKFVRKNHIQDPNHHWKFGKQVEQNGLKKEIE